MRNKLILGVFFMLLCATGAFGETTIKAEVDQRRIAADQTLTYKLIVSSTEKSIPQPQMPAFEGFAVISQAQSSTISFMQRGPKSILILAYILAPLNTGKFAIQPSRITIQGKTYTSEAFEIEVMQGKGEPQPQPERHLPPSEGTGTGQPQVTL
jgi:hypothetical protein